MSSSYLKGFRLLPEFIYIVSVTFMVYVKLQFKPSTESQINLLVSLITLTCLLFNAGLTMSSSNFNIKPSSSEL